MENNKMVNYTLPAKVPPQLDLHLQTTTQTHKLPKCFKSSLYFG